MNIVGKIVLLRAIEENELSILHKWANDPETWYMAGGWHFPSSMEIMKKWFESLQNDNLNIKLAIQAPDVGLIGMANLVNIDWKNNHASYGMMIGNKDMRGKGYGIDATMAMMRYAFEELHFERLDGEAIEYNEISLNHSCKKCGWKVEGRARNWYFKKNRYWDKIIIGVTRQDYYELIASNHYWD
jgi:RimJ/RimL family protein N-acetyltransferase